jgi:hypothetical protein
MVLLGNGGIATTVDVRCCQRHNVLMQRLHGGANSQGGDANGSATRRCRGGGIVVMA